MSGHHSILDNMDTTEVSCCLCQQTLARSDLEGHVCAEHLDYYPYGCVHCGHWLATEELVAFHAEKKQHLPIKIRENPNLLKERRLKDILASCLHPTSTWPQQQSNTSPSSQSASVAVEGAEGEQEQVVGEEEEEEEANNGWIIKQEPIVPDDELNGSGGEEETSLNLYLPPTDQATSPNSQKSSGSSQKSNGELIKEDKAEYAVSAVRADVTAEQGAEEDAEDARVIVSSKVEDEEKFINTRSPSSHQEQEMTKTKLLTSGMEGGEGEEKKKRKWQEGGVEVEVDELVADASSPTTAKRHKTSRLELMVEGIKQKKANSPTPPAAADADQQKEKNLFQRLQQHEGEGGGGEAVIIGERTVTTIRRCTLCQLDVRLHERTRHVERHLKAELDEWRRRGGSVATKGRCLYCHYVGKSLTAVRVHITWKHKGYSTKAGIGVKALGFGEGMPTFPSVKVMCFGSETPRNLGMLRPYASRANKSVTQRHSLPNRLVTGKTRPDERGFARERKLFEEKQQRRGVQQQQQQQSVVSSPQHYVSRTGASIGGRLYRFLICQVCKRECCDAMASAHVYVSHIRRPDAVKCAYCEYGTSYSMSEVKKHVRARHPSCPIKVIDNRIDLQDQYLEWRRLCFPDIGLKRDQTTAELAMSFSSSSSSSLALPVERNNIRQQQVTKGGAGVDSALLMSPQQLNEAAFSAIYGGTSGGNDDSASVKSDQDIVDKGVQRRAGQYIVNSRDRCTCAKCGEQITQIWKARHVWKHLWDEEGVQPLGCPFADCDYRTYLKRSLDSHYASHHLQKGKTTDQLGLVDHRQRYARQYWHMVQECFDDGIVNDPCLIAEPPAPLAAATALIQQRHRPSQPADDDHQYHGREQEEEETMVS